MNNGSKNALESQSYGYRCQICNGRFRVNSSYLLQNLCQDCIESYEYSGEVRMPVDPISHSEVEAGWTYLYVIQNSVNGKTYYGRHRPTTKESFRHYLGGGRALRKAIDKYGAAAFSKKLILLLEDPKDAAIEEARLIYSKKQEGSAEYNIAPGGGGGYSPGNGLSFEEASKVASKLWKDPAYRERVTQAMKSSANTPASRAKRSEVASKMWQDATYREKIVKRGEDHYLYGREMPEAHREALKEGQHGFYKSASKEQLEALADKRRPAAIQNFERASHVSKHVKQSAPNRLCLHCESDGMVTRPSKEELEVVMAEARSYAHMGEMLGTKSPQSLCEEYGIPHPSHFRKNAKKKSNPLLENPQ